MLQDPSKINNENKKNGRDKTITKSKERCQLNLK